MSAETSFDDTSASSVKPPFVSICEFVPIYGFVLICEFVFLRAVVLICAFVLLCADSGGSVIVGRNPLASFSSVSPDESSESLESSPASVEFCCRTNLSSSALKLLAWKIFPELTSRTMKPVPFSL